MKRCKVFSWGSWGLYNKTCEICLCPKDNHKISHNCYVPEEVQIKKSNSEQIKKEKEKNEKEREEYINKMDKKMNEFEKQKRILDFNKNKLLDDKKKNMNKKNDIQKKLDDINYQIILNLVKLQSLYEQINFIAMNTNHLIIESKYIDSLFKKMEEMGKKNEKQIKMLNEIKENNKIFNDIKDIDFSKLDYTQIAAKLGFINPNLNTPKGNLL